MKVIPNNDQEHLELVAERVQEMQASIAERTQKLSDGVDLSSIRRLADQAIRASTAGGRVHWLRQMSAVAEKVVAPQSACRSGCSHCCHIAVAVSQSEAIAISKEIGVPLQRPSQSRTLRDLAERGEQGQAEDASRFTGVPCTFLRDDLCSIYDSRPLVCRTQFNMDRDELLCRLVEGAAVPVPYFDNTALKAISMQAFGFNAVYADIREWFGAPRR